MRYFIIKANIKMVEESLAIQDYLDSKGYNYIFTYTTDKMKVVVKEVSEKRFNKGLIG